MKKIAYLIIIMIISLVNFAASLQWKYWIEENVSNSGQMPNMQISVTAEVDF